MRSISRAVIQIILVLVLGASAAGACPRISGLRDFNSCDGRVVLAFVGDSLTYGVGDPTASTTTGGYPGVVGKRLPNVEIRKYAVPGINAMQLWRYLHRPEVQATMTDIDYAIVTVGTNNYWRRTPHIEVVRRIARIVRFVRSFGAIASAATVPPTLRETPQKVYLEALNSAILLNIFPKVRFDTLPVESKYFVSDKLHMTRAGYRNMASIARQYFTVTAQGIAEQLQPDEQN
jgi:lysophospholipase L1-like esterase